MRTDFILTNAARLFRPSIGTEGPQLAVLANRAKAQATALADALGLVDAPSSETPATYRGRLDLEGRVLDIEKLVAIVIGQLNEHEVTHGQRGNARDVGGNADVAETPQREATVGAGVVSERAASPSFQAEAAIDTRDCATLADRLTAVLESGTIPSARRWCAAAGLSPGLVSAVVTRANETPDVDMTCGTVERLARAAGVNFDWLARGVGLPRPEAIAFTQRLECRIVELESQLARALTVSANYASRLDTWEDKLDKSEAEVEQWRTRCIAACDGHVDLDELDRLALEQAAERKAEREESL